MDAWILILSALGVALFLEGLPWFVSPGAAREALAALARLPDGALRLIGLALMAGGLLVVWASLH